MLKYIPAVILALCLWPGCAGAGDLDNLANTLENLADMSRSADEAGESLRKAARGEPSRYWRETRYRDYDDDDEYYGRRYRDKHWKKEMKKREKHWRKHHRDERWHRPPPPPHGRPPFPPSFW